jgi:hypothetical protein
MIVVNEIGKDKFFALVKDLLNKCDNLELENYQGSNSFFVGAALNPEDTSQDFRAISTLNCQVIWNCIDFPTPIEQKIIVAKVNTLVTLCAESEVQVQQNKTQAELFMEPVLREFFETGKEVLNE